MLSKNERWIVALLFAHLSGVWRVQYGWGLAIHPTFLMIAFGLLAWFGKGREEKL